MRHLNLVPVAVLIAAGLFVPAPAQAAPQTIQVNLGQRTGPVHHGANGALYGMSDDGVPSDNVLTPLKIKEIAQKPPAGLQHPNGDTLMVADAFFRTGGEQIQVYIQDMYPTWPYDDLGIEDYLQKVETVTRQLVASPHRDRFVYVPFNEPDFIWYDLRTSDPDEYVVERDRFLSHWARVVTLIRSIDPGARIAGPGETSYDSRLIPDFLAWTRDRGLLPDIFTWHELSPNFFTSYRRNYESYRALERRLGIGPLPISINEYANRRDLTVPGQMVQWVSRFEDTKVDADMPYWDVASNLAGQVVQTNKPNGGWWFLKMYADMTGETVAVTPPDPNGLDTLQGMASIDDAKRQAHIVVGGTAGDTDVVIRGVDSRLFGSTVRARVSAVTWSGYDADSPPPVVLADGDHRVRGNGTLTVPLRGIDRMAAYEIVLSPGGSGSFADTSHPWQASYEAEAARIVDATVFTQGTPANANGYATSGTQDVGSINQATSSVTFPVSVPETGRYRLSVLYGNQTGDISQQVLRIDGGSPRFVDYPATLNWTYRARKDVDLDLTAGNHELTFATTDPTLGAARGEAVLDRIDLRRLADRVDAEVYEAELTDATGARYSYDRRGQSGPGYLVLPRNASTTFVVFAPEDGYYDLSLRYSAPGRPGTAAELTLGGTVVDGAALPSTTGSGWQPAQRRMFLPAGINRVGVRAAVPGVALDMLTVRAASGPIQTVEAEASGNQLGGTATVVANPHASGGAYVGFIGNGAANTLTVNGITAPRGGQYMLAVRYANDERGDGHQYNTNIISRAADISVNGGPPTRVWFRNTWAWNNFWTLDVPITLRPGQNTIQFANPTAFAPNLDRIGIAPVLAGSG